jgi:predicted choloylglycine hydrolase
MLRARDTVDGIDGGSTYISFNLFKPKSGFTHPEMQTPYFDDEPRLLALVTKPSPSP